MKVHGSPLSPPFPPFPRADCCLELWRLRSLETIRIESIAHLLHFKLKIFTSTMSRHTSETSLPTRQRPGEEETGRERLVVGIDYGTTNTSVAYKLSSSDGMPFDGPIHLNIQPVEIWPGKSGMTELPTKTIYFKDARNVPGFAWGFKAETLNVVARKLTDCHYVTLAKLLLHSSPETNEEIRTLRNHTVDIPKPGTELVGDFLAQLHDYLFREDPADPGYFWDSEPNLMKRFRKSDIEFVIGVPAAWTEQEQIDMLAIAERAGFEKSSRVSEPEAVATEFFANEANEGTLQVRMVFRDLDIC